MDDIKEKLEQCQKQSEEYLNGWKRAKADLINSQKDEQKRFEEMARYSVQDVVKDLIVVLDSFDLALATLEKQGKGEKGVYMIRTQLEDLMKKRGVERIVDVIGVQFDPAFYEAVAEGESDKPEGTVIEEIEKGYLLHGKVVRPARVKIAKAKNK